MENSFPLVIESKRKESSYCLNDQISGKSTILKEKDLYLDEENDGSYNNFLHNSNYHVFLEVLNVIKLSNLLNKQVEDDCDFLIINVRYKWEVNQKLFSWEIKRSYLQIKELLFQIKLELTKKKIKIDNKDLEINSELFRIIDLKEYPSKKKALLSFLNEILNIPILKESVNILEFLEVSSHSFESIDDNEFFLKPKEGYILKRCKPSKTLISCLQYICCSNCPCCKLWQRRWFVLKDEMIFYLDNSNSSEGKDIFWFDQEIIVIKPYKNIKNSIGITNISRKLVLKFEDELKMETWYQILISKIQIYNQSMKNVYDSFANERSYCNAVWFVDAHDYFSHLYDNILRAKESIFIAGWWVSPELYLKRPVRKEELYTNRLLDILKQKAEKGVNIHILIYKEFKMAISLNSEHTKEVFNNLHPNIKVTRHPKASLDLLWSHHEKMVIIDQIMGYTGGVDLCWGRYDNHEHKLFEEENSEETYFWPGIDFSNLRVKDFNNLNEYVTESVPRSSCRMPWHDVTVFMVGPVVGDLNRHFIERWNYARTIVNFRQHKTHTITNVKGSKSHANTIKSRYPESSNTNQSPLLTHKNSDDNIRIDTEDLEVIETKNISKAKFKFDLTNSEKNKDKDTILEKMKNVFLRVKDSINSRRSGRRTLRSNEDTENFLNINIKPSVIPAENNMNCQILRSVSNWSAGLVKKHEDSILRAYYNLIDNSKHYIFIENQFFISKSYSDEENFSGSSNVVNEVALRLRRRIEKAFESNKKFRVFIILPLLPGFPGEVKETVTLQIILKYTYKTISRNRGLSLIEKLYQLMGEKFEDYISFFSLRTHGILNEVPYTEMIYVHSKIMIVDDEVALIGSANINDRSLKGSRDSEIAVIIRDNCKVPSKMDGKIFLAANFAQSLRIRLLKEHLGYNLNTYEIPEDLLDPLGDKLIKIMKEIANSNTIHYRQIFNCYPDDNFKNFSDLDNFRDPPTKEKYNNYKDNIFGNLVEFPLNFLKQEYLNRNYFCKEILVPLKNFL